MDIRIEEASANSAIEMLNKPYKHIVYVVMHSDMHYDDVTTAFEDLEDAKEWIEDDESAYIVKTYMQ